MRLRDAGRERGLGDAPARAPVGRGNPVRRTLVLALLLAVALAGCARSSTPVPRAGSEPSPVHEARVKPVLGELPLYFVENRGQLDDRVAYYVAGPDTALYFTAHGVTFGLTAPRDPPRAPDALAPLASPGRADVAAGSTAPPRERWAVALDFVGADAAVRPVGQDLTPAMISYFKGPRSAWRTGLPAYAGVLYPDVWPGIDLVYAGTAGRLKYTFFVKPGADPNQIRLAYRGATDARLTEGGELELTTPVGGFRDARPYAYQEGDGVRSEVAADYALEGGAEAGAWTYGFRVGAYDASRPLVLDPVVLFYAGYVGGAGLEEGRAIAVDAAGNAYVVGTTASTEATFPVAVGPDPTYNGRGGEGGDVDAFVAKVNAAGTALLYAGYIGGAGSDSGAGVAVDGAGNAYVAGFTNSTEATFPVLGGPDLTYNGGGGDAFVAKVNASGTALVYAGYVGGAGDDSGAGVAVDGAGNAYLVGSTASTEATFPVLGGPDLTYNGGVDAFVAKVNPAGTALLYAGYVGGASFDIGRGIAVDGAGNAYLTGFTASTEATFPVLVGPDLTYNGGVDAFVAKVNPAGTALLYAGYVGGAGDDSGAGAAVDAAGNAYLTGSTASTEATFSVLGGPDLTYNGGGGGDAFVAKVNAAGTALLYAGYIGGAGSDSGAGVAVDGAGNAYVAGFTNSTEATFPVLGGPDLTYNGGGGDAFVAKVNASGTALVYAGYVGGAGDDSGAGVAVDGAGNAYLVGSTASTEATFPVLGGPDLTYNGGVDAFVAKISADATPTPTATPTKTPPPPACSTTTSIVSNFNGTSVAAGNTIWFGSVLKAQGLGTKPVTIRVTNGTITGLPTAPGGLPVPDAAVTFSPTASTATTIYDRTTNTWITQLPMSFAGNGFLTGLAYVVPSNLAGGTNPVTWSGTITSDTPGVTVNWQWAAAVYNTQATPFPSDVNGLGVKPVDDNHVSVFQNSDHAGTPEYVKGAVIGGARGGGGSNYTGSLSATASAKCG